MSELVAAYPLCRHIKTNGRRCQSPALAGQALCHFHRTLRRVHRPTPTPESEIARWRPETLQFFLDNGEDPLAVARANPRPGTLNFPPLEDAESIQLAISALFAAIAAGQIQAAHARSLLYALQIASFNVRAIPRPRDPDPGSTHATATAIAFGVASAATAIATAKSAPETSRNATETTATAPGAARTTPESTTFSAPAASQELTQPRRVLRDPHGGAFSTLAAPESNEL